MPELESLIERVPGLTWNGIVGAGISFFVREQQPEWVEFKRMSNGWQLIVKTDKENAEEAQKFWNENIKPRLE